MKTELKAKYLQHLLKNKKDKSAGFTLIELLVVIIIIGILAAIALPSFLSQAAKAKQSEGKQNVAAYNSTQAAYRTDSPKFASTFDVLAIGSLASSTTDPKVANTQNYTYTMTLGTDDSTKIVTAPVDTATKTYAGATARYQNSANQPVVTSVVCESLAAGTTAVAGVNTPTATAPQSCPASSTLIGG